MRVVRQVAAVDAVVGDQVGIAASPVVEPDRLGDDLGAVVAEGDDHLDGHPGEGSLVKFGGIWVQFFDQILANLSLILLKLDETRLRSKLKI